MRVVKGSIAGHPKKVGSVGRRVVLAWFARLQAMLALLSLLAEGVARYQVCDFTCPEPSNASWLTCRSEKCTPRLPEDFCPGGQEPTLTPEPGAKEGEGRAVAGPAECAEAGAPVLGSFAERCELCLSLAQSAINLARRELTPDELAELGASALCERAGRDVASLLPTVRTCRMMPTACTEAVAEWQNSTCPLVFEPLTQGASMGQMMSTQQTECGLLLSQRAGSGVHEAEVCPALRDIGGRIMAISGVVAAALFAAQLSNF